MTIKSLALLLPLLAAPPALGADRPPCVDAEVISVFDGDTLKAQIRPWRPSLLLEEQVRIMGYNTPELMKGPCRAAGRLARDHLTVLLKGGVVRLCDVNFGDPYGRVLARVEVNGVDVAAVMIAAGLAREYHGVGKAGTWCPAPAP